jgi:hypothetical protein
VTAVILLTVGKGKAEIKTFLDVIFAQLLGITLTVSRLVVQEVKGFVTSSCPYILPQLTINQ